MPIVGVRRRRGRGAVNGNLGLLGSGKGIVHWCEVSRRDHQLVGVVGAAHAREDRIIDQLVPRRSE